MEKHLMIATPAYDGKVHIPYAISLTDTVLYLSQNNIKVTTRLLAGGALLVADRNRIVEEFWRSECTHLLCIDSDLGWPMEAITAMLQQELDFMGGVYPARMEESYYFVPDLDEEKKFIPKNHLLKGLYIPAGFILISRNMVKIMREKYPELRYEPKNPAKKDEAAFMFFDTEVYDGEFWGEDFVFCRRAREAGIDLWVDPLIEFDHCGKRGKLIDWIAKKVEENNQKKVEEAK